MKITTIGNDLTKTTLSLHAVDAHGKTVMHRALSCTKLIAWTSQLEPCLVGIEAIARDSDPIQRIMANCGIGALSATAVVASVGDATLFRNGRRFCAWLGLAPRQFPTGGKPRLGRITKRGDSICVRSWFTAPARHWTCSQNAQIG